MVSFLRTTRGRVAAALLTSLAVVALALVFTDALPILPAGLIAVWVPVFAPREPVSPPAKRLMLVLTGVLTALAGVGLLVFFAVQT
jgi:hypothetical protein